MTSKIDSRTILGEQGAEQLLGQGDMLHMQGGGRIYRVHGPFVSDDEVEKVVAHLKTQGQPDYLDSVTDDVDGEVAETDDEEGADGAVFDKTAMGGEDDGSLYEQAVKIVLRDKKSSVSYVQRRLQVGYNKAASLIERMEKEGSRRPREPHRQARDPGALARPGDHRRAGGRRRGVGESNRWRPRGEGPMILAGDGRHAVRYAGVVQGAAARALRPSRRKRSSRLSAGRAAINWPPRLISSTLKSEIAVRPRRDRHG